MSIERSKTEENQSTDEWFDTAVCRPLSRPVARFLARFTPLTANHVSGISALVGLVAGVLYAFPGYWPAVGAVIFFLMMVLDCADGELARLRGGGTWQGRMYDGMADLTATASVHIGMLVYLSLHGVTIGGYTFHPFVLFLIACTAGGSMIWNAAVLDKMKQQLKTGSIDQHVGKFEEQAKTGWDRLMLGFFRNYIGWITWARGKGQSSYPLYRRVQWAGPTHHYMAMLLCGVIALFYPLTFFVYFVVAIFPVNAYMLLMLWQGRRAEAHAEKKGALAR